MKYRMISLKISPYFPGCRVALSPPGHDKKHGTTPTGATPLGPADDAPKSKAGAWVTDDLIDMLLLWHFVAVTVVVVMNVSEYYPV